MREVDARLPRAFPSPMLWKTIPCEVPMLPWTEIETRAMTFQKRWKDCAGNEIASVAHLMELF